MIGRLCWLLMTMSLVGVICSTLALVAGPSAEVSAWAGWSFLGLSRVQWQGMHDGLGLLLAFSGLVCVLAGSRRMLTPAEGEPGNGPAVAAAFMVLAVFVLTSVLGLPPASLVSGASRVLKAWHAKSFGEPPVSGAADLSPRDLAKRIQLDPDKAVANLVAHNVKLASPAATLAEIAKDNGLVPAAVYETLRGGRDPVVPQPQVQGQQTARQTAPPPPPLPADPPPGLGRLKLSDVCEQYGLDLKVAVDHLNKAGVKASGDMTLRQIAQSNLMLPIEIYDGLRAAQGQNVAAPQSPAQSATAAGTGQNAGQTAGQTPPQAPSPQFPGQTPAQGPSGLAGQLLPPGQQGQAPAQGLSPAGQPPQSGPASGLLPALSPPTQAPGMQPPGTHAPGAQPPGQQSPGAQGPAVQAQGAQIPGGPASPLAEPPAGLARMTLAAFCKEHGQETSQALAKLKAKGIVAFSDMTFREVAIENALTPEQVMEIIVR